MLKRQLGLGAIAEADVFAQEAALAQLESTLPPLQKQLDQTRDQLAVLSGRLPSDFAHVTFELDELTLPTDMPLGVPSQLVERRPDVRAAEAMLHAATAEVGVAIANMLPQLTITGNIGSSATLMRRYFQRRNRLLECRRQRHAVVVSRRHPDSPQARGAGRRRSGRGHISVPPCSPPSRTWRMPCMRSMRTPIR